MGNRDLSRKHLLAITGFVIAAFSLHAIYAQVRRDISKEIDIKTSLGKQIIVNNEKWENFLKMGKIPTAVRQWYTYSETEAARLSELESDDPEVIDYIRKYKLIPVPPERFRTKLPPRDMTSRKYGPLLMNIFQNKTEGFFIECGAFDGLSKSITFLFERQFNWTGMLIEADPNNLELIVEKKRNAIVVPACLSGESKPKMSSFIFGRKMAGRLTEPGNTTFDMLTVQCLPLYSLLLAANVTTVDLLSLDLEGNEMDVLLAIPFEKVDIKVLLIEVVLIHQGKKALDDFLSTKGYVKYPTKPSEHKHPGWAVNDEIFIKKGSGIKETRDDM